ncbi:MAG TPA: TonB-dependent receptor [Edaphocola sp.]|nr:TonB-dependent receptor [Edaphocola sp.]
MKTLNVFKLLFILITFSTYTLKAQSFKITGNIIDSEDKDGVPGLMIMTKDSTAHAVTDESGNFILNTLKPEGEFWIFGLGYQTTIKKFNTEKTHFNIELNAENMILNGVTITAFGTKKSIKETAGSIAFINGESLRQGNGTSMQQAFNSVAGVRMDHSNGEDSKISIRGEGIRAPWGIRNIKIYLNDIPLTETDGTSRIEGLDLSALGQAEIIKGPASSLYGGGKGGVILFQLEKAPYQEQSVEATALFGSYGLNKQGLTYRNSNEKFNSYLSIGRQFTNEFRDHSSDKRNFIAGNFQWISSNRQKITLLLSRTHQDAQMPGALTQDQVAENPKQANLKSIDKKSGRKENWTRVGLAQQYDFNKNFNNSTSIFTYFYDLDHPLPFGIINNTYQSVGVRTRFEYDAPFKVLPTIFTAGTQLTYAFVKSNIYQNNQGVPNGIFNSTNYKNQSYSIFYQSKSQLSHSTDLVFGLSINGLKYNAINFLNPISSGIKDFQAQLSPRIAVSQNFSEAISLHASISSGFSNPSADQILDNNRNLNQKIQAEKGINYEIDAKGAFLKNRLNYDLAVFTMDMKGELIGQSLNNGITVYHNTGRSKHTGVELAVNYKIITELDGKWINILKPYLSISYSNFNFIDYKVLNEANELIHNYNGNQLTGTAPWMISSGLDLHSKTGLFFNINSFFNDAYYLNDANTEINSSYFIVNSSIGFQKEFGKNFGIRIYTGVQNLTNEKYSSYTEINAEVPSGAKAEYFQPSATRNTYMGLAFKYYIHKNK